MIRLIREGFVDCDNFFDRFSMLLKKERDQMSTFGVLRLCGLEDRYNVSEVISDLKTEALSCTEKFTSTKEF
jgi:hypothetical protein